MQMITRAFVFVLAFLVASASVAAAPIAAPEPGAS